jgi:hypothetical protein
MYKSKMATLAELRAEAKRQKRKGYSKLKKAELEKLLDTPPPKPPRGVPRKKPAPAPKPAPAKKAPVKEEYVYHHSFIKDSKASLVPISKTQAKKQIPTLFNEEMESDYLDTLSNQMSGKRAMKVLDMRKKRAIKDFWSEYTALNRKTEKEWKKAWKDFEDDVDLDDYGKSNE